MSARTSGVHARFDWMTTSDAIIVRASPIRPARTLWMRERRVTMAPTPIATQTKKNSRRRHDARSSRAVMRRTKLTRRPARRAGGWSRSATAASSGSCVTSTSVVPRERLTSQQEVDDVPSGGSCRDCRSARRPAGAAARWRAPARWRPAAARRRRAATDSGGPVPRGPPPRAAPAPAAPAPDTPAISIGTSTFSSAVSDGRRWKNWNTKPIRLPRSAASASSPSAVMSIPPITMRPVDGASSPATRPSSVDLPLPEAPVTAATLPSGITRSSGCRIVRVPAPLATVFETPRSSIMNSLSG